MDLNQLSVQQLAEVRKQMEAELEHLSESFSQLCKAQTKFLECAQSVKQTSAKGKDGQEMMVPLTASLYVPGKMADVNNFIVDVGTDYFVEKDTDGAVKFFNNKVETLNKNLVDLDRLVNEKMFTLQKVEELFKTKYNELQRAQASAESQAKAEKAS